MSAITSDATLSLCSSLFCSSFRRRPESSSFFVFSAEVQCFHSPCGRAGNFSLLVQRKVTKRNTPQVARLPGILPSRFASGLRGSLNARPCACSELARIVRATLRAFSSTRSPRHRGPVWAASCRRSTSNNSTSISLKPTNSVTQCQSHPTITEVIANELVTASLKMRIASPSRRAPTAYNSGR